jgi:hypothetical protein
MTDSDLGRSECQAKDPRHRTCTKCSLVKRSLSDTSPTLSFVSRRATVLGTLRKRTEIIPDHFAQGHWFELSEFCGQIALIVVAFPGEGMNG